MMRHHCRGIRVECPLENVLDEMSPAFGPSENVLQIKYPLQKCPLEMVPSKIVL